jgi:predicted RNA-binding protein with TRAM domain
MEVPEQLRCLYSAQLTEQDGSCIIEVPEQEVDVGQLQEHGIYRVAMFAAPESAEADETPQSEQGAPGPQPPVEEGETRTVEIDDLGDQGDGITRVDRGYVVIVPDTTQGERVRIRISDVQRNVAFAEVVERVSYYD